MELTPFVTRENGTVTGARAARRGYKKRRSGPKRDEGRRAGPMLVKLGICAAACLTVVGLKAIDAPVTDAMVDQVRAAVNTQTDVDEMLGKLKFVELPGILEVFAEENGKMVLPVNAPVVSLLDQECLAKWEGVPYAEVVASAAGEVRSVGEDPVLGKYVRLKHPKDLETIYYGLKEVWVEEGQPIRRRDTLGTLGDEGTLCLGVLLAGRPEEPAKYFDLVFSA